MERHNYNTSGTRGRVLGALPSLRPRHTSPQQDAIASQEPQGNIAQELRLGKWHTDMDVPRGGGHAITFFQSRVYGCLANPGILDFRV